MGLSGDAMGCGAMGAMGMRWEGEGRGWDGVLNGVLDGVLDWSAGWGVGLDVGCCIGIWIGIWIGCWMGGAGHLRQLGQSALAVNTQRRFADGSILRGCRSWRNCQPPVAAPPATAAAGGAGLRLRVGLPVGLAHQGWGGGIAAASRRISLRVVPSTVPSSRILTPAKEAAASWRPAHRLWTARVRTGGVGSIDPFGADPRRGRRVAKQSRH